MTFLGTADAKPSGETTVSFSGHKPELAGSSVNFLVLDGGFGVKEDEVSGTALGVCAM